MFYKNNTKIKTYSILTGVFCACLIISNILAFKTFTIGYDIVLPCAVIIFPITYIVEDVLSEVYGFTKATRVIILAFIMNLIAVTCYSIAIMLPAPTYFAGQEAFSLVLGNTPRILIASFTAYLIGSLVNSYVMVYLKEKLSKYLFFRCITSTLLGEGLDAIIFISIAFMGTMPLIALIGMIIAQAGFKTLYEVIVYPVTYNVIGYIKALP